MQLGSFKRQVKRFIPKRLLDFRQEWKWERAYLRNSSIDSDNYPDVLGEWFLQTTHELADWNNPQSFNQKIQWLKLYDSSVEKGHLADKYLVRDFVSQIIGDGFLIPLIGVWDSAYDIDFHALPCRFALKATHGCGWNIIVDDKTMIDVPHCKRQLNHWLSEPFWLRDGLELHYRFCQPRIIAEEYLDGWNNGTLIDYKVHCFNNGSPIILVCDSRVGSSGVRKAYYDSQWMPIDLYEMYCEPFVCPKPIHLDQMLEFSSLLSDQFAFVRIDWYEVNGKLYFGEMTFTPANGAKRFVPESWNYEFGRRIDLTVLPAWQEMHKGE